MTFDVLHLDGRPVRRLPYVERREIRSELGLGDGPAWRVPRHVLGDTQGERLAS
jgi:ATP-dependent DNA ligase